jgi:hypothetical protein
MDQADKKISQDVIEKLRMIIMEVRRMVNGQVEAKQRRDPMIIYIRRGCS